MEISGIKSMEKSVSVSTTAGANTGMSEGIPRLEQSKLEQSKLEQPKLRVEAENKRLEREDIVPVVEEMNKFMQAVNTDLQFAIHEKTNQMMVQMVDAQTQRVVKEFPAHELLDMVAKIREYVGFLLDEKA